MDIQTIENDSVSWGKRRSISVILAVFFGPLAWIYTLPKDFWKLFVGLGVDLTIVTLAILVIIGERNTGKEYAEAGLFYDSLFGPLIVFCLSVFILLIWIWAVADCGFKSSKSLNELPKK